MLSPIEEIKSRLDIVELVSSYIRLQRAGSNFKALCPFHTEKTPSFNVSPTRQIWHCFGCGKGGDHFKFVMEIEGLDFPEALRLLAEKAGVELKREDPRVRSERNRLHDLLNEAARYFQKNLETTTAIKAYLKKRGVTDKTIEDFRIGFAFDAWDGMLRHLHSAGFTESETEKAGLAVNGENGHYYDRFRSRIIFPVADTNGRVVGFGGRIFEPTPRQSSEQATEAKYINTPQTPVYDKSRVLYAFDKAKDSIRKNNSCVVVEGYMDAIMSHQAGITNAIAVSGTALTPAQLKTIRRLADTLISCFDRDQAGEAATKRSLNLAAEFDFERKAAVLPSEVKDPADAVLADPKMWQGVVEGALPIVQFYFEAALRKHSPGTAEGTKAIAKEVLPEIGNLGNEVEKSYWISKLSQALRVSEESLRQELAKIRRVEASEYRISGEEEKGALFVKNRKDQLEELFLGSLVLFRTLAPEFQESAEKLLSKEIHRSIFRSILGRNSASEPELKDYVNRLAFQAEAFFETVEEKEGEIRALATALTGEHLKERRDELTKKIVEAEHGRDEAALTILSHEYKNICDELRHLTIKES